MIPKLTNVFAGGNAYVWLRLRMDGEDLELEACEQDWTGEEPDWYTRELSENGIESIIGYENCWFYWALTEGLAPGQPFCVEILPPVWSKSGYEYVEWDCEWTWEIVQVLHRKPATAARDWERFLKDKRACELAAEKEQQRLKLLREKRVADMIVCTQRYFGPKDSPHDEMCPPTGLSVEIISTAERGHQRLAEGRDDDGDYNKAFEKLVEDAAKRLPRLSEEVIKKLPQRSW